MNTNDLKEILRKNPKASRDAKIIKTTRENIRKLSELGIEPKEYSLASPFERIRKYKPEVILTPDPNEA